MVFKPLMPFKKNDEGAQTHNLGSVLCPARCADTGRYRKIWIQLLALPEI